MQEPLPNFDEMLELAQNQPEQLEELRQRLARSAIEAAPAHCQRRLWGLQFEIDSCRRLSKNPLSSCQRISAMMHESLDRLRCLLNEGEDPLRASRPREAATVLSFDRSLLGEPGRH